MLKVEVNTSEFYYWTVWKKKVKLLKVVRNFGKGGFTTGIWSDLIFILSCVWVNKQIPILNFPIELGVSGHGVEFSTF